jgi:uncharacterized protein YegL
VERKIEVDDLVPPNAMTISVGEGERRQPVYLLLDTSQDTVGAPIEAVSRGVEQFKLDVQADAFARETIWVGVITFGGKAEFVTKGLIPIDQLVLPPLTAGGQDVLGEALQLLGQSLDQDIRPPTKGGSRGDWRPLVFILLASEPTDDWREPREKILQRERTKIGKAVTVGCGPYINPQNLKDIAIGGMFSMDNDDASFKALFQWIDQEQIGLSIIAKPPIIDFGCVPPGTSPCTTVRIEGGPAKATANNIWIQVTPAEIGKESTDVEVALKNGSDGDLIWDILHIQGDNDEIDIPVICWWDETLSHSLKEPIPKMDAKEAVKSVAPEQQKDEALNDSVSATGEIESANSLVAKKSALASVSGRTYIALTCPYCGRNLRYDSDNKIWLKCDKCTGVRVIISVPQRVASETRLGIEKDGKKILRDLWEVITGKQKWNLK